MILNSTLDINICVLLIIFSYLIGAIPNGLIIGKIFRKIDIREHGSKNIGTTNSIRVLGKKLGFATFFLDVFKGAFIIIIVKYILEPNNIWTSPIDPIFFGAAAIIGHAFPIYIGFKGGKAVATSLGVVLSLTPLPAILCLIVFVLFLYSTGYVSLGSSFAAITVVTSSWILNVFGSDSGIFLQKPGLLLCILYSILGTLILVKHKKNYSRLLNGTENNFKKKKKAQKETNISIK